jgi:colicin import membrane protein
MSPARPSDRTPGAFFMSLTLHGSVVAIMFLYAYATGFLTAEKPKVFELVAGVGDNYMATEAPALGSPGGIKLDIPTPPTPQVKIAPEPVAEPTPVVPTPEPTPITPAPVEKAPPKPKVPTKPVETTVPNFKKQIANQVLRAKLNTEKKIAKERAAEAKRITKEEFERDNKAKTAAAKSGAATKIAKIDAEGIAAGVVGGSTKNKTGGAGGKALVAEDGAVMDRYFSLLKSRLKENHEKPTGLSDTLVARVEFYISADGSISRVKISRSSGSAEFDRSVLEAFSRTKSIGARPDKKGEQVELEFKMREEDGD